MVRILTVDDSREIRESVSREVEGLGFAATSAADADEGLARLRESPFDLVLLDLTMPGEGGAGMLTRMREIGCRTPVLMLTSASKNSLVLPAVSTLMRLGIEGFIVKPPKPGEIAQRIKRALRLSVSTGMQRPALLTVPPPTPDAERPAVDVLLVDDMTNVQAMVRRELPERVTLDACGSALEAFARCREKTYRAILVDTELSDVTSPAAFSSQLRALQPQASVMALSLRTASAAEKEVARTRFDAVIFKPFDAGSVKEAVLSSLGEAYTLACEENVARVATEGAGAQPRLERLDAQLGRFLSSSASACFPHAIVDLSAFVVPPAALADLVGRLRSRAVALGIELRIVGSAGPEPAVAPLRVFASVDQARAG
jgi:CheY-like chemotaxis protein